MFQTNDSSETFYFSIAELVFFLLIIVVFATASVANTLEKTSDDLKEAKADFDREAKNNVALSGELEIVQNDLKSAEDNLADALLERDQAIHDFTIQEQFLNEALQENEEKQKALDEVQRDLMQANREWRKVNRDLERKQQEIANIKSELERLQELEMISVENVSKCFNLETNPAHLFSPNPAHQAQQISNIAGKLSQFMDNSSEYRAGVILIWGNNGIRPNEGVRLAQAVKRIIEDRFPLAIEAAVIKSLFFTAGNVGTVQLEIFFFTDSAAFTNTEALFDDLSQCSIQS